MECRERIISNDYADGIVDFPLDTLTDENDDMCYLNLDFGYSVVYDNRRVVSRLLESTYQYQYIPKLYGLEQINEQVNENEGSSPALFDSMALQASGILALQREPLSLTGRGVLLIVIDTGIDYTNPVFRDENGNTRIVAIWDQTIQEGRAPAGFVYGTEYTREDINRALASQNPYEIVPSRDENGHGTALASVAAGSILGEGAEFIGAAPDAEILVVKLKECKQYLREFFLLPPEVPAYQENDIMLAIQYANSFIEEFRRPGVFCLGLGNNKGDHNGNSFLEKYIDRIAVQRSRGFVIGGGNEGNFAHHVRGVIERDDSGGENYRDVEIRVGENERGFVLEFWGDIPEIFTITIRSPGGETIPPLRLEAQQVEVFDFIFERTTIAIQSVLVESASGAQLVVLRFDAPTAGIWNLRVGLSGGGADGVFHMWLPLKQFLSSDTYFLEPDPDTTLTAPAYTRSAIGVSTYNAENDSFYPESGRGFARSGDRKPDLAAPGENVPTILGRRSGSSLAAAITAGAVAQYMQWAVVEGKDPLAETQVAKNYLIRAAKRFPAITYPNREWGYGILRVNDIFGILSSLRD